jgi:hypothetical protein
MRRRGEVETMHVVVGAVILLLVMTVSVIIYTQYYGKTTNVAKCHIENLNQDCDCDGVPNAVDTCPCGDTLGSNGKCKILTDCYDSAKCVCSPDNCKQATASTPTKTS